MTPSPARARPRVGRSSQCSAAPRAIDLFCGAGGLTEGLRRARFRVIAALDNDELATESYQLNHPRTRLWVEQIQDVRPEAMMKELGLARGDLDLLAGCPPCQGFSSLRTRNGRVIVQDPQNELIFEFVRFVKALRPRALMLENVPALQLDRRMDRVRRQLRALGYCLTEDVLDAAEYGVPQRRRRFILLGLQGEKPYFGRRSAKRSTVRTAIARLPVPGTTGDEMHDISERRTADIRRRIADIPPDGGSRSALGPERQYGCHQRSDGWKDIFGRMAWSEPAPTITGGCANPSKGRFLHPEQDRCITLREAALLQSFRPNYRISLRRGKFAAAQLIGNALPPRFVERHARALHEQLTGN
jgi:DNA (cytosine-5)-methyltransferase 1